MPISPFRERITDALARSGCLVLTAPTGGGKSTQTPQFLLDRFPGKVLVLEPRRLAARSLASRVAAETRTTLGERIGYQVRFESRQGPRTAVLFETYGVFLRQALDAPGLDGVAAVILDEFHERTLETDLALAWLKALRRSRRRDLRLLVMSAALDAAALCRYLDCGHIDVPGRLFPVDIRHLPPQARELPAQAALRALRSLAQEGLDGSVLVFMPGLREIRRSLELMGPFCREHGLGLEALHGAMELADQQKVLDSDRTGQRVIVATNVAETSLTIPGVTMVVDSGLHRVAAYSAERDVNTLYVARISRANALQRAGRAGRIAPGRCIRLWAKSEEAAMPEALLPEVSRLELSSLFLQAASLPEPVDWLTPPKASAWSAAVASLRSLGAADETGRITAPGRALLRYPVSPKLAAILRQAASLGREAYGRACAMVAVFESASQRRADRTADLYALAGDLMVGSADDLPWEASEIFRQLERISPPTQAKGTASESALARLWLAAFADRLAARKGQGLSYELCDGRSVLLLVLKDPPPLILALDIRERAGAGEARQVSVPVYLPCEPALVKELFPEECTWKEVCEFDEGKQRVVKEERLLFRGLALERRDAGRERGDRKASAGLWAEKFACGELAHPGFDERAAQLVVRINLASKFYPELGFPALDPDDWRLIYGEACAGRNSLKEIGKVPLTPHITGYLGAALTAFLDRVLPERRRLPSGKSAKFTYSESRPAELAARLGDFLKMSATLSLCDGRLPVVFDILAPNYRTVQKTADLGSFWKNTYPTVKKELQRRYPKHPWP